VAYYALYICEASIQHKDTDVACSRTLYQINTTDTQVQNIFIPVEYIKGLLYARVLAIGHDGKTSELSNEPVMSYASQMQIQTEIRQTENHP
jgi:hypothetical protein